MIATLADLLRLSHEGGYFRLALQGVPEFTCEIVRRIPDQRLVCRGQWGGQVVLPSCSSAAMHSATLRAMRAACARDGGAHRDTRVAT